MTIDVEHPDNINTNSVEELYIYLKDHNDYVINHIEELANKDFKSVQLGADKDNSITIKNPDFIKGFKAGLLAAATIMDNFPKADGE